MIMENIYLIDAVFQAKKFIRSLPHLHAARWGAWLRFACSGLGMRLNDILYGLLPLRNGQNPVTPGEQISLRLITCESGVRHLARLAQSMRAIQRGEFSPESFDLLFWKDAIGGGNFSPECSLDVTCLAPFGGEALAKEIAMLETQKSWTLAFHVPLRFKLPPAAGQRGKGVTQFCPPTFFADGRSLRYLFGHIRHLEDCDASMLSVVNVLESRLAWVDMRYNEFRQIALGGVMGHMKCGGAMNRETAQRCVFGQYLGVGKNPLFGLGYWRIPELDNVRTIAL